MHKIDKEIEEAVEFAENSSEPDIEKFLQDISIYDV